MHHERDYSAHRDSPSLECTSAGTLCGPGIGGNNLTKHIAEYGRRAREASPLYGHDAALARNLAIDHGPDEIRVNAAFPVVHVTSCRVKATAVKLN